MTRDALGARASILTPSREARMSEMIERVEDAIMEAMNADPKGGSFSRAARAAIEAMREPTDAMVASVCGTGLCPSGVADIYIDMIDAALSEVEG